MTDPDTTTEQSSEAESNMDYAGFGTATLSKGVSETEDGEPFVIHGVALGSGDVTIGMSGIKKVWPASVLEEAAESLEGQPLVKNHENNAEGRIGTVVKSRFRPGVGVLYEAEIAPHYDEFAKDIAAGILDVSPRVLHAPVEELELDEETDALVVQDAYFDNLSVVDKGAAPSNTAVAGPSPNLSPNSGAIAVASARVGDHDGSVAVLSEGVDRPDAKSVSEMLQDEPDADVDVDVDVDADELGLFAFRVWGPLASEVPDTMVDSVREQLDAHDALTAVVENSDRHDVVVVVDSSSVSNNDQLNTHVISALDETPFSVSEKFDWIEEAYHTELSSGSSNDLDYEELSVELGDADGIVTHDADGSVEIPNGDLNVEANDLDDPDTPDGEQPNEPESESTSADTEQSSEVEAEDEAGDGDDPEKTVTVASYPGPTSTTTQTATLSEAMDIRYESASEDAIEEMNEAVVTEKSELEALKEKAARADKFDDRLEEMNSSLDELGARQEKLDDVDDEAFEELTQCEAPKVVEAAEFEELSELVESVGTMYAEALEQHSPFTAEELMDRFTPVELRDKVEEHDEAELSATIQGEDPEPEGETVESEELSESEEELAREEKEEEARKQVSEALKRAGWESQAQQVLDGEIPLSEFDVEY